MSFTKSVKSAFITIKNNLFLYLLIWGVSEFIAYIFLNAITFTLLNLVMKHLNLSAITNENFITIFKSPFALLLIVLTLLSLSFLAIFQMLAILSLSSHDGKLKNMFKPLKRLTFKDIPALLTYTLLIIPFSKMGLTIYFLSSFKVPAFIFAGFWDSSFLTVLYYFPIFMIEHYGIKFMYSFIIFYEDRVSFTEAMKMSFKYTNGKKFYKVAGFLGLTYFISIISSIVGVIFFNIFESFAVQFYDYERIIVSISAALIITGGFVVIIFNSLLLVQLLVCGYSGDIMKLDTNNKYPYLKFALPLFTLAVAVYGYYNYSPDTTFDKIEVIAHRGATFNAIENTVESLVAANELNAAYVELDIQQLADGVIVVIHDNNLKRLASENVHLTDLTWPEVKNIQLTYKGLVSSIPRFDEYLNVAKNINQPLLVEVKVNKSDDENFVEDVIKLIKDADMQDMVLYQSLSKDAALKVRSLDPSAKVGYIMGFTVGGVDDLDVDFFSIDETSVTKKIVRDAKANDQGLYIWSVDSPTIIHKALSYSPSAIISDQIIVIEEVKEELLSKPLSRMMWQLGVY